jgi:PAS domain S-box-containing protein
LFEDLWLIICCRQGIREVQDIARHSAKLVQSHATLEVQALALEQSLLEREAILEGALDAVIQMDCDGRIISWNTQATQVFGWNDREVIGRGVAETIIPAPLREDHNAGLRRYLAENRSEVLNRRIEVEAKRRDGSLFPVELAITPVTNQGRVSFCAFLRDISERKESEIRLKQAKEAAEAANQAKSLFLANMSHEIRTPLNAILGFTDLLLTSEDSLPAEERRSHLDSVHRSGAHLLKIINDILDLSKIEAGQMQYEHVRFSPHHMIVDILSSMRVRAAEKGITLDARWLGRVPESIVSDPSRMRQVLLNLVANAIKFTERGGVQILGRVIPKQDLLQFEVIDTGVGIPADKLDAIFAPFTQADVSVTRKFGGTGLGLSICRYIVDSLGGEITAQSSEEQGSTFTVTFATGPLAGVNMLEMPPSETLRTSSQPVEEQQIRLNDFRVLIVDDGETNRRLLKLMLTRVGATVETAEHGLAAIEQVTARTYDAILMDMQMPTLDGYSATKELRARNVTTPIIALTAHAMTGEEEKCRAAGCDGYLTKPINQLELVTTLFHLKSQRESVEGAHEADMGTSAVAVVSELDLTDPEVNDIVNQFIARLEGYLGGLRTAWQTRDWIGLDQQAHSLKGTAAMIGFPDLSAAAARLEEIAATREERGIERALASVEAMAKRIHASADAGSATANLVPTA